MLNKYGLKTVYMLLTSATMDGGARESAMFRKRNIEKVLTLFQCDASIAMGRAAEAKKKHMYWL